jgi:hypothetical protein
MRRRRGSCRPYVDVDRFVTARDDGAGQSTMANDPPDNRGTAQADSDFAVAAETPSATPRVPDQSQGDSSGSQPVAPPKVQPVDEFDPLGWDVPLVCKDCDKDFSVPYRHFHAGVVFHCPHCNGSWVPNTTIAKGTRRAFAEFRDARGRAREAFERGELKLDRAEFERREAAQLRAFHERLQRLAREMRPAGKLVRRKGLGAMFT